MAAKQLITIRLALIIPVILAGFWGTRFMIDRHYSKASAVARNDANFFDFSDNVRRVMTQGLTLFNANKEIVLKPAVIKEWEDFMVRSNGQKQTTVNGEQIKEYLNDLAPLIAAKPTNAKFGFKNGQIHEKIPGRNGRELDIASSMQNIRKAILYGAGRTELVFKDVPPAITKEKVAALGINSLIGTGESDFGGSSEARIHNIKTATRVYDGILVEPDKELSFNELLGEVDDNSGYKAELVIKGDKILPEYGGGICQVSTTLFRSAISSGLPITERRSHSLPVRYYKPQGFDATIYPGVVDLKFKNDTGGYVLITADFEDTKLVFNIYGPDSERIVSVSSASYYDIQSDGALKAMFSRTVTYPDGTIKKDDFYSSYKSPEKFENLRNPLE